MKFICNTADLSDACQNVSRAASGKTAIPAIEGILITTGQNTLTLTGYDLEMGITTQIPSNVEENGSIVLNAHMLSDILRRLPGDTVSLESDEEQTYLEAEQVQTLYRAIRKAEKVIGEPISLDWGFVNGVLYILRTRPLGA